MKVNSQIYMTAKMPGNEGFVVEEHDVSALRKLKMNAVCVRNACKQYGSGSDSHVVLEGLDMTVEKGIIYGLLGASGCGKTTLLTCIVGRRRLGSGDIWVLGGKPGSKGSGVPGPRLGYMPQELSLMREFSIRDALQHFAWIYGMSNKSFAERYLFLEDLLDLPNGATKIKNLSGGQQRRASLAVALINDPELLILDEPTVGLDPVLRQKIWDYLVNVANQGKTIIITTHYIEEAKQAHKIGLMRNGRLMAEGSPQELLVQFNASSIEQVFLYLSEKQETGKTKDSQKTVDNKMPIMPPSSPRAQFQTEDTEGLENGASCRVECKENETSNDPTKPPGRRKLGDVVRSLTFRNKGHAKALLSKNFYRTTRNPGAILFIILFPILEICAFFLAVGGWPKGMKLGIVNEELVNSNSCSELITELGPQYGGYPNITQEGLAYCSMRGLSCKYLALLNDSIADKVYYDDYESGMKAAKAGNIIGLLHFASNFSESFEARLDLGADSSNGTINSSELQVYMDMALRQSALLVEQKLRDAHRIFMKNLFNECEIPERVGTIPVHFEEPVYGQFEINFSVFMAPGVVITMVFFISVGVTAMIIVVERLDGIWDRTLCAGISSQEILLSHAIMEAGIVLIQSAEVFLFVFYIFQIPCLGSYWHIMVLLFLQGFTGMCGGFLVSVSCNTITSSNYVSMGSFYPVLILSGLLWPVEGMPPVLRALALAMPTTLATSSLRNIMEKGWGMFDNHVYQGYLVSLAWIVGFSLLSLMVIKFRK